MAPKKLTYSQVRALRAAERGDLFHSVYGYYDWIALGTPGEGRVTVAARKLRLDGLIELLPRRAGHEHRGQPYKLTDAGRAALAATTETTKD